MSSSSICEAAACMYIQQLHFILLLLNEFFTLLLHLCCVFSKVLAEAVLDMTAVLSSNILHVLTGFTLELLHFSLYAFISFSHF